MEARVVSFPYGHTFTIIHEPRYNYGHGILIKPGEACKAPQFELQADQEIKLFDGAFEIDSIGIIMKEYTEDRGDDYATVDIVYLLFHNWMKEEVEWVPVAMSIVSRDEASFSQIGSAWHDYAFEPAVDEWLKED